VKCDIADMQSVVSGEKQAWSLESLFILVINQLDAQNFCFTMSLFHAFILTS